MVLPIGLVFEIMLFRSSLYRKTLDSVLRLRFSPADTLLHSFLLTVYSSRRVYIPA